MCCDSWGRKKSDTTERLNWTALNTVYIPCNKPHFLYSPASEHFGCFYIVVVVSDFTVNKYSKIFSTSYFQFFWIYIYRCEIVGLYSNSIFSFLRSCPPVFFSDCTILYPNQWSTRVPVSIQPHKACFHFGCFWFLFCFSDSDHPSGYEENFMVVLMSISLITSNAGQLLICLLAIYVSSLKKCLSKFFAHF